MNYLTTNEVQKILKLGNKQIEALFRLKDFPSVWIGNKWLVEENALREYLSKNKTIKLDYRGITKPIGTRREEKALAAGAD